MGGIASLQSSLTFWDGAFRGAIENAVDGFITGALLYCATQAIIGIVKVANKAINKARIAKSYRVFWSGGDKAQQAATIFAEKTGRTTLEMTELGKSTISTTKGMPWTEASGIWDRASATYAQAAVNSGQKTAYVFINNSRYSAGSVWARIEKNILEIAGIKIILKRI